MKLSEKLLSIANWLEDENNELLVDAEKNDKYLEIVAEILVKTADTIKENIKVLTDVEEKTLTPEKLDELAALAEAFDESGDEFLQKQASVLDELLLTIAAPKDFTYNFKKVEEQRMEELKKKYQAPKKEMDELNKVSETLKALEKSDMMKAPEKHIRPLSTRCCPDHAGQSIFRVGDGVYQCSLDGKIYDFENGYKNIHGETVPGGSVALQSPGIREDGKAILDTREQRLLSK
jgi:hypothetical protein